MCTYNAKRQRQRQLQQQLVVVRGAAQEGEEEEGEEGEEAQAQRREGAPAQQSTAKVPAPGLPACAPHWVTVTRLHAPPPPPHQDKKESKKHKKERKEKKGKKEKKREKERAQLAVTASGSEWGKYGILREGDMYTKQEEFLAWLAEVKGIIYEQCGQRELKVRPACRARVDCLSGAAPAVGAGAL